MLFKRSNCKQYSAIRKCRGCPILNLFPLLVRILLNKLILLAVFVASYSGIVQYMLSHFQAFLSSHKSLLLTLILPNFSLILFYCSLLFTSNLFCYWHPFLWSVKWQSSYSRKVNEFRWFYNPIFWKTSVIKSF